MNVVLQSLMRIVIVFLSYLVYSLSNSVPFSVCSAFYGLNSDEEKVQDTNKIMNIMPCFPLVKITSKLLILIKIVYIGLIN